MDKKQTENITPEYLVEMLRDIVNSKPENTQGGINDAES